MCNDVDSFFQFLPIILDRTIIYPPKTIVSLDLLDAYFK